MRGRAQGVGDERRATQDGLGGEERRENEARARGSVSERKGQEAPHRDREGTLLKWRAAACRRVLWRGAARRRTTPTYGAGVPVPVRSIDETRRFETRCLPYF